MVRKLRMCNPTTYQEIHDQVILQEIHDQVILQEIHDQVILFVNTSLTRSK